MKIVGLKNRTMKIQTKLCHLTNLTIFLFYDFVVFRLN